AQVGCLRTHWQAGSLRSQEKSDFAILLILILPIESPLVIYRRSKYNAVLEVLSNYELRDTVNYEFF
ncbi:MAG: hypothetical protein FWC43_14110, partial [Planctomycetaceae bacterium]|nr:hypothetical protein [Planctomycetaceae bacterium]